MGKRKSNFKEISMIDNFDDRWMACEAWLNKGPESYKERFYIKDYEDNQGSIEQILINNIPDEIKTLIELVWEDAITKKLKDSNFNLTKYVSEELHYELPFRNSKNADEYIYFNREGENLRQKYIQSFNPYRTLLSIFNEEEVNCVAQALAIKETIPDKKFQLFNVFYEDVFDEEGNEKLGIHTILAKQEGNRIITIDSNEGPINDSDKINPFKYIMDKETFSKNYTPALFKSEYILKK